MISQHIFASQVVTLEPILYYLERSENNAVSHNELPSTNRPRSLVENVIFIYHGLRPRP